MVKGKLDDGRNVMVNGYIMKNQKGVKKRWREEWIYKGNGRGKIMCIFCHQDFNQNQKPVEDKSLLGNEFQGGGWLVQWIVVESRWCKTWTNSRLKLIRFKCWEQWRSIDMKMMKEWKLFEVCFYLRSTDPMGF